VSNLLIRHAIRRGQILPPARILSVLILCIKAVERRPKKCRIKMKKMSRSASVVLITDTTVWGLVVYYTLQEYCKFVEGLSEFKRKRGLWDPWWRWNAMPHVIIAGICLICAWALLIRSYLSSKSI
jgi:hypothetical protein